MQYQQSKTKQYQYFTDTNLDLMHKVNIKIYTKLPF